jgi:molecular chaperone DnaK (HSP70)
MESPILSTQQRPNVIGINIGNAYSSVAIIELVSLNAIKYNS